MQVIRTHVRAGWEAVLIRTYVRATVILPVRKGRAGARFLPRPGAPGGPLARAIVRPAAASDVPPRGPGHRAVARHAPACGKPLSAASATSMLRHADPWWAPAFWRAGPRRGDVSSVAAQRAYVGACS